MKSSEVLSFIKQRGIVSTNQIVRKFGIRKTQAAANLAVLRIQGSIVSVALPKKKDTSSHWVCTTK